MLINQAKKNQFGELGCIPEVRLVNSGRPISNQKSCFINEAPISYSFTNIQSQGARETKHMVQCVESSVKVDRRTAGSPF